MPVQADFTQKSGVTFFLTVVLFNPHVIVIVITRTLLLSAFH